MSNKGDSDAVSKAPSKPANVPLTSEDRRASNRTLDSQIFNLALPALGALIAEPIFLATDTVMVGHLGAASLGGLAIASSLLQTMIGLMIFLAYATTPLVARRFGAGDMSGAYSTGFASLIIAAVLGILLSVIGAIFGPLMIASMNPDTDVAEAAGQYFYISLAGIPAMLMVLALTGLMRGLQDTKTPLYVSVIGFGLNILLNFLLIYGLGLGIAGSATGLVIVQWLMFFALGIIVFIRARAADARFGIQLKELLTNLQVGFWLFLRTITLRFALLASVVIGTSMGTNILGAYQIVFTLFSVTAFALDALAIAAQALVGKELGSGNLERVRVVVKRTVFLGIICGIAIGILLLALSPILARAFSSEPEILELAPLALVVLAISMPLSGYVFVLDGVLMGTADVRYLAFAGVINICVYLPMLWGIIASGISGTFGIVTLTAAFCLGYMTSRALTLGLRIRGEKWLIGAR